MQRIESLIEKDALGASLLSKNTENKIDHEKIWSQGQDILAKTLDSQVYKAWIKPLDIKSIHLSPSNEKDFDTEVTLLAPNKFTREHILKNYSKLISDTFNDLLGRRASLKFNISENRLPSSRPTTIPQKKSEVLLERGQKTLTAPEGNLNPGLNFSNFVIGSCNQFAHAASLQVSENLGRQYNPLFIYGGVGLGKTHLANSVGNASRRRNKKVLLVSSELFVSELISSLRSNSMSNFKAKYRSLDLLIIDDIQFLDGKERTQEEFFHTFNELHQKNKQIILTSDKVPQELLGIEERLKTRFASGLTCDLQAPDFETRVAILCKKAEAKQILLSEEVASIIAETVSTNVRELEGALNRLIATSELAKRKLDEKLAKEVLLSFSPRKAKEITAEGIQRAVIEVYNVSLSDLVGKRRTQNIAFARQVAMYLSRKLTSYSYPEIGAFFGGRDHSTVIHAVKTIEEKSSKDSSIKEIVAKIEASICG